MNICNKRKQRTEQTTNATYKSAINSCAEAFICAITQASRWPRRGFNRAAGCLGLTLSPYLACRNYRSIQ